MFYFDVFAKMKGVAVLFFISISLLQAQTADIQQLLSELNNSADNIEKVDLLVSLSEKYLTTDVKKALDYAEDGLKLAKKLKYPAGESTSSIALGKVRLKQGQLVRAANNFEAALPWAEKNAEAPVLLDFYFHLAQVYQRQGRTDDKEIIRQKYLNLQLSLQQQQINLSNQEKIELLTNQFSEQKDSVSLARLEAIKAQSAKDSALHIISQQEATLNKQRLDLVTLENQAMRIKQEKLQTELLLKQEQQQLALKQQQFYWILIVGAFLLLAGLGAWFYYQSRQAKKLAQRERLEVERLRLLTAGIAHEIKNPLNFVNNFAEGSSEIAAELEETLDTNEQDLKPEQFALLKELTTELKQNAIDIKKNGQRVNEIVRSMTDYASGRKSKRQKTALNDLIEEQINRAYQAYRTQHEGFDIKIEKKYDAYLSSIEIVAQDIGRVLLNLLNNACDAMLQKQGENRANYTPTLSIVTMSQNGEAVIRIRDNGTGIAPEVRDKIFTPFFTTKPTGTGNTGLGLSISYDIIVKDHHGKLKVESEAGEFTEFIITLPKK